MIWETVIITVFPSLSFLQTLLFIPPANSWAHFITNCYCMHIRICIHINITFSVYVVLLVCMSSGMTIGSGSLVCSSLGKTNSPASIFPHLPTVFYKGLRPHRLFFPPIHFAVSLGVVLLQLTFGRPCW